MAKHTTPDRGKSTLLDHLPAIYRDPGWAGAREPSKFLNDFLLAFEDVLLGRKHAGAQPRMELQGLEERIDNLHLLFDAWKTPSEFLDWLAGWAALSLNAGLSERQKRELVANIIQLYRIRGTRRYLERLLGIFLGGKSIVDDHAYPGLQIRDCSTVAKDTYLGGSSPHYFRVRIAVSTEEYGAIEQRRRLAREVIERAKPAHTYYDLEIVTPRFQVGVHSRVGLDTFLVTERSDERE
jgi:phage tail-like protein